MRIYVHLIGTKSELGIPARHMTALTREMFPEQLL